MGTHTEEPILIACGECSNRRDASFQQLRDAAALLCPVCGHDMKRERTAVLQHIDAIRNAIGAMEPIRAKAPISAKEH